MGSREPRSSPNDHRSTCIRLSAVGVPAVPQSDQYSPDEIGLDYTRTLVGLVTFLVSLASAFLAFVAVGVLFFAVLSFLKGDRPPSSPAILGKALDGAGAFLLASLIVLLWSAHDWGMALRRGDVGQWRVFG